MGHLVTAGDQAGQAGPAFHELVLPGLIHDDDQFHDLCQHQGQTDRLLNGTPRHTGKLTEKFLQKEQ